MTFDLFRRGRPHRFNALNDLSLAPQDRPIGFDNIQPTGFVEPGSVTNDALATLVQGALADDPTNMLVNGGGEVGSDFGAAPGWTPGVGSSNGLFIHPGQQKYGARSLSISNFSSGHNSYAYQDLTVVSDVIYVMSGWIKTTALPVVDGGYGAVLNLDAVTASGIIVLEKVGDDPNAAEADVGLVATGAIRDWTFVMSRFKFSVGGTVRLFVQLGYAGGQQGDAWFDGLRFARLSKIVADDIVAGQVTTEKLGAGSVTAEKVAVGAMSPGKSAGMARNLVADPGFERGGFWTQDANHSRTTATKKSGAWSGTVTTVNATDYLLSETWDVIGGRRYYASGWARGNSGGPANGANFKIGLRVRWLDSGGSTISDVDVATPIALGLTDTFTQLRGFVVAPSNAVRAFIFFTHNHDNIASNPANAFYDDVEFYAADEDVSHAGGNVVIDATGITVTNGKITVTNPGSTVIIDGSSNMFKIAATGTHSVVFPGTHPSNASTITTLSGITSGSVALMCMPELGTSTSFTSIRKFGAIHPTFMDGVTGGFGYWGDAWHFGSGTTDMKVEVIARTVTSHPGATVTMFERYYVLKESSL